MKTIAIVFSFFMVTACASNNAPKRQVATAQDLTGEIQIKNQSVRYTVVDRGWRTQTGAVEVTDGGNWGGFPTIEAVKSYLIIHETNSAAAYNQIKVDSALKGAEQCQAFGATEKTNTKNQVAGYTTTVTAKIVNNLEMPANFTLRYVCLVSVLAVKK